MSNSIYANARAKAHENNLIGKDRLNRLIDCESVSDCFKILSEINFGGSFTSNSEQTDFESILLFEQRSLTEFIASTCPSNAFKYFFLLKNDYHNAESFIKSKYLKKEIDDLLVDDGIYQREKLKNYIFTDEYNKLTDNLSKTLSVCDELFVNGKATGEYINTLFFKSLYSDLLLYSKNDNLLKKIIINKINCSNISTAIRSRNFDFAKDRFLEGGTLTLNEYKLLCEQPVESLRDYFKVSELKPFIYSALEDFENNKPLSVFEKLSDEFPCSFLKKFKYSNEGYIPFMLYCFYKQTDISNVRIILSSIINGLDKDLIKERIRLGYEG